MDKLDHALKAIALCNACNGKGNLFWDNGDDYDFESCECNPYELILDDNGDVLWDNGLLSEPALFATMEAK